MVLEPEGNIIDISSVLSQSHAALPDADDDLDDDERFERQRRLAEQE